MKAMMSLTKNLFIYVQMSLQKVVRKFKTEYLKITEKFSGTGCFHSEET